MEIRHLRYFIAVAEEGSLTLAAEKRLHTAQPSLSRQIRHLEHEVGTELLTRSARGVELTPAGQVFLEHARMALAQIEAGREAARRTAKAIKPNFAVGFLSGHEVNWLVETSRLLGGELQRVDMTVSSEHSPELAEGLLTKRLDVALMRAEPDQPGLEYVPVATERFVVVLPSDHHLTEHTEIDVRDLVGEVFIGGSSIAGPMRDAIERYLKANGLEIVPTHRVHNLTMAMSLVASTRGVALLPAYTENFLPWSVTSRPLRGEPPTTDLVVGYAKDNNSPTLSLASSIEDRVVIPHGAATSGTTAPFAAPPPSKLYQPPFRRLTHSIAIKIWSGSIRFCPPRSTNARATTPSWSRTKVAGANACPASGSNDLREGCQSPVSP
jgi:LysR family hca operon transcriptional activator